MTDPKAEQQGQEWHPYAVAADRIVYRRRDGTESGDVIWFGGNRICRDEVLAVLTHHDRLVQALEKITTLAGYGLAVDTARNIARAALKEKP